ncbi:copper resistance CopC/CopD family protein [Streptomyces sp. NBC_01750]|uniref:copper resistance CopC/CopD family protein n=1 Tax=Streptomyces sp. NBC_01750 TaxID=2975928 RepID=UPI002DD8DD01|nr:copper resistance protein CopC [Streptomyces sp. NBC_01750]WSD33544.1 copper resistance protein CopC [Streptomyces sp. NBC_01750]
MHRATLHTSVYACVALLLAALAVVVGSTPARAHASVASTAPADRQVLGTPPTRVSLTFTEPVSLGLTRVGVIAPDGDTVATGRPEHPGGRAEKVAVRLRTLSAKGTYTIVWHTVSADSHPVQGTFSFSVGRPTDGSSPASAGTEDGAVTAAVALHDAARWVSFVGFAVLVGTAFFVAACWPAGFRRRPVHGLVWTGWSALMAATVLSLLLYGPYAAGTSLFSALDGSLIAATLGSRMGLMLVLRAVLLALVAAGLVLAPRRVTADSPAPGDRAERASGAGPSSGPGRHGRRRNTVAVLGVGCALALTWSLAGHSAAGPLAALAVPADAVHLVAMAVWTGGLVVLGTVLLRSRDAPDTPVLEPTVTRFSRVAGICVVLLLTTGLFQAWRQLGSAQALPGTLYGRVLLAKLCLVAVLVGLGAGGRAWVRRHYGPAPLVAQGRRRPGRPGPDGGQIRRFKRLVTAETLIAAVLLAVSTVLANTDPATAGGGTSAHRQDRRPAAGAAPAGPRTAVPFSRAVAFDSEGRSGKGVVAVVVSPAARGVNEVHLAVFDTRGRPRDVPEVRAEFSLRKPSVGPIRVPLTYAEPGHHISSAFSLPLPGRWELALTVRTSDIDQDVVRIPVDIR